MFILFLILMFFFLPNKRIEFYAQIDKTYEDDKDTVQVISIDQSYCFSLRNNELHLFEFTEIGKIKDCPEYFL